MPPGRPSRPRDVAIVMVAAGLLALVAGGGGCEGIISGSLPSYECVPGPDSCPSGQACDPATHECAAVCTSGGCGAGMECNTTTSLCVVIDSSAGDGTSPDDASMDAPTTDGPRDERMGMTETGTDSKGDAPGCTSLGCPCSGPAACTSAICSDMQTVTAALLKAAGSTNFCTQPCCTSADCDANTVCFATGAGGNYCVKPAWLMRSTTLGKGLPGSACTPADGDCRSGLCTGGKCVDTCCSTAATPDQCTNGDTCQFGKFPGATGATDDQNFSAWCGAPPGGKAARSACSSNGQCQSDLCNSTGGPNECIAACRGAKDCTTGSQACQYVIPYNPPTPTPIVGACFGEKGSDPQGTACTGASDKNCLGLCDATTLKCTDLCFADSDCTFAGWRCRPEPLNLPKGGSYSVLLCGP